MDTVNPTESSGGIFGRWIEDENGLPAYRYEMRHDDPAAVWDPIIKPKSNLHWHQLGNRRITANAYNLGMVKVFYGETGQLWLNEYDPSSVNLCGGFGWLAADGCVLTDLDDCIPDDATWDRIFGTGYFLKRLAHSGIVYERRIFAPAGDVPVLISEVRVRNVSGTSKDFRLTEYWGMNFSRITRFVLNRLLNRKTGGNIHLSLSSRGNILSAFQDDRGAGFPEKPCWIDGRLPGVFLACLDEKPDGWIINPALLPEKNGRPCRDGQFVIANELRQSQVMIRKSACLAAAVEFSLETGGEKVLRFAYGYAKGRAPVDIVESVVRNDAHVWETTAAHWKTIAPSFKSASDGKGLDRELKWNSFYFHSSSLYDAYYKKHYMPQAGNYLYDCGFNGASRDFFENIMTLVCYDAAMARESLEFMMRSQKPDGSFFYSIDGFGKRNRLFYRPSDLGLWFIWALSEYVFATRDFYFLETPVPFYPADSGKYKTVWEHAVAAFTHLIKKVGTGRHGHLKIRLSDWNDEMTWLAAGDNPVETVMTIIRGESVLNTAMACFILPMFERLAHYVGDAATAGRCRDFTCNMKIALGSAWHDDHLVRAYSGFGKPFGADETWLEPLVWALLAKGSLEPEKESAAVETIRKRLLTPAGLKISDSGKGSMTTRKGEQESGGIWFAINSPAAIALSRFDRNLAWEVFKRNTLAHHAGQYPDKWYGILSGPDAFNGPDSSRPGESWYQKSPVFSLGAQAYPVQNIHAHSQMMFALAKLAGIAPTAEGWTIKPRIPHDEFSFSCSLFGIDVSPGTTGGYVCLPVSSRLSLKVELTGKSENPVVTVGGKEIPHSRSGRFAEFSIDATEGEKAFWKVIDG